MSKIATETTGESSRSPAVCLDDASRQRRAEKAGIADSCVREHSSEPLPAVHPPLARNYAPFGETLSRSGTRLLAPTFASDLCSYVARVRECKGVDFYPLMAGKPDQVSLVDWLTVQQSLISMPTAISSGIPA